MVLLFLVCSETQIQAIEARPRSPDWLVDEVALIRDGLMRLCQNVLLLQDPNDADSFYPVCPETETLPGKKRKQFISDRSFLCLFENLMIHFNLD